MAIGFSPRYKEQIPVPGNYTTAQFLVIAVEAIKNLDWNLGHISENGLVAYTPMKGRRSEEIRIRIVDGTVNLQSETLGEEMIDWGRNKKNIKKLVTEFGLFESLTPAQLAEKYEELKPDFHPEDELPRAKQSLTGLLAIFTPVKGYFVTPVIININIAVYIAMVISGVNFFLPDNDALIRWGADFGPYTLSGEWWRLLTSCFIHIGILHLLFNMYALLYIGLLLEQRVGSLAFAVAYLLTGLCASITSISWHPFLISAGASGAIFGLYGVFLALLTTNIIERSARKALLTSIGIFVFYNLANGMKGGIDNAAHLGGLISGIVIGYAYFPALKAVNRGSLQNIISIVLAAVVLFAGFKVLKKIPNDLGKYDQRMQQFADMENRALSVYKLPDNASRQDLLTAIKDTGLYYWNRNLQLLSDADMLSLPDALHKRNGLLIKYCRLRIKAYQIMYTAVDENAGDKYKEQIEECNKEVAAILDVLKKQAD
jgi:rhomboid protease GluP